MRVFSTWEYNIDKAAARLLEATGWNSPDPHAYPTGGERPLSSNLNTVEGPPIPNMAVLKYGANNTVRVYNLAGYAHYLFDASAVVLADLPA